MPHLRSAFVLAPFCIVACSDAADPIADNGDLRMGVVGQDGDGLFYRLRDATFSIDGPESVSVSTEAGPTTEVISVELAAGSYEVLLEDGWRLERWDPIADATLDVEATLTSENPAFAVVTGSETAGVVFIFNVPDAGPVVLGDGDLEIDIDIDTTPPSVVCDPLLQNCGAGEGCYPTGADYICAPSGGVGAYGECQFINECAPATVCVGSVANVACNQAADNCCLPFCSVAVGGCGPTEFCGSLGIGDPDIGVCAEF